jgi:heat shock protein HspQ
MLAALDRQAKQAAALAAEADATAEGKRLQLRLGQRVVHKDHGYRGVVVGWDVGCCESEEWQERAGAEQLKNGLR